MMTIGWKPSTVLLGLALALYASSPAAAQAPLRGPAGLTVENEPIEGALRLLQRTAGVSLVYSPDLLPAHLLVSCVCEDATVEEALDQILAGTDLRYSASRTQIRITPRRAARDDAAVGWIRGRVVDVDGGAPIVNAMIRLHNGQGVLSDAAGFFTLRNVPAGTYRMVVTSIGWRPSELATVQVQQSDTTRLVVELGREAVQLADILVSPGTFGMLEDVSPGTVRALTREEMQMLPQMGEDVFRAVRRLPGVNSDDISTKLIVRGGYAQDVLVRLDGQELYEPYHLKDWDGALGIVDVNAVGGVQLSAGGFGVEHGDKTAGVLDMTSRTWVGDATTTLGFSISNLTAMSRGSFADEKGSWLFSARRGFMDWVMALIGESELLRPRYYDVFGKVSRQLGRNHQVSLHVLHAGDEFVLVDRPEEGMDEVDFHSQWGSSYAWATWEATLNRLSAVTAVSTGRVKRERNGFIEDLDNAPNMISVEDHRDFTFAGLRHDLSLELSERAMLKVGGEVKRVRADYAYSNVTRFYDVRRPDEEIVQGFDSIRVDVEPDGNEMSAYLSTRVRPVDELTAEFGVRYDHISHTGDDDIAPRVLAAYSPSDRTTLRASWGWYYQSQGVQDLEVGDGASVFASSERAEQVAAGLEHGFGDGVRVRLEAYRRSIENPHPSFFNLEQELEIFPEATGDRFRLDPDRSRARGLEFLVERRSGTRWAWSASYVLAWSEDEVDGVWIPRRFDQRHTVGLHATYRPDNNWSLTAGWRFHTGWPATSWTWDVTPLASGYNWWEKQYGPVRGERLPAYHRLDIRATRDFLVGGHVLNVFVDLFNAYDRTNLGSFDYSGNYVDGQLFVRQIEGQTMLPLLPTFGLRYEF